MISREQMQELKELAKPIKYKVVKDGSRVRVDSKCSTTFFSYDQDGYKSVKFLLERLGSKVKKKEEAQ